MTPGIVKRLFMRSEQSHAPEGMRREMTRAHHGAQFEEAPGPPTIAIAMRRPR